ncbi:MAG TPA: hypothetical protein DEA16_03550 [Opitutae bacterium]|jgi:hypothetical protein|nr:hypothetical protein [Opitutae bacterium]HBR67211.1 hypothetical protein [Opitutae bacterium]
MSDSKAEESNRTTPSVVKKTRAQGVRYSLNEMLGEVAEERKLHTRRELLDANEIGKMFADKRHIKRTIK